MVLLGGGLIWCGMGLRFYVDFFLKYEGDMREFFPLYRCGESICKGAGFGILFAGQGVMDVDRLPGLDFGI